MAYSDFNLEKIKQKFQINTIEDVGIFANSPDIEPSQLLLWKPKRKISLLG